MDLGSKKVMLSIQFPLFYKKKSKLSIHYQNVHVFLQHQYFFNYSLFFCVCVCVCVKYLIFATSLFLQSFLKKNHSNAKRVEHSHNEKRYRQVCLPLMTGGSDVVNHVTFAPVRARSLIGQSSLKLTSFSFVLFMRARFLEVIAWGQINL